METPSAWREAVLGVAGAVVGMLAMRVHRQRAGPAVRRRFGVHPGDGIATALIVRALDEVL